MPANTASLPEKIKGDPNIDWCIKPEWTMSFLQNLDGNLFYLIQR